VSQGAPARWRAHTRTVHVRVRVCAQACALVTRALAPIHKRQAFRRVFVLHKPDVCGAILREMRAKNDSVMRARTFVCDRDERAQERNRDDVRERDT